MNEEMTRVVEDLRSSFAVDPSALQKAESILDLQAASLAEFPASAEPSEAIRDIARERLDALQPIIPRARFPFERERIATLMGRIAAATLGDSEAFSHPDLVYMVEAAQDAACSGDPMGVLRAFAGLQLPPESSVTLFREALKPEMLRSSHMFAQMTLARGELPSFSCPVCGSAPCGGTRDGVVCCSFCGGLWKAPDHSCFSCKSRDLRRFSISSVKGSELSACADCREVLGRYGTGPNALGISLHGILAAPIILATRVTAEAPLKLSFRVF